MPACLSAQTESPTPRKQAEAVKRLDALGRSRQTLLLVGATRLKDKLGRSLCLPSTQASRGIGGGGTGKSKIRRDQHQTNKMSTHQSLLTSYASDNYEYERGSSDSSRYDVPSDWRHDSPVWRSSGSVGDKERAEWRHAFEAGTTPADGLAWREVQSHRLCAKRAAIFSAALFANMLVIKSWCALGFSSDSRHHCFGFHVADTE